jgi:hypothetical protein
MCKILFFALLIFPVACPIIAAPCQPSAVMVRAFEALPSQTTGSTLHQREGLAYLDIRCLDEARAAFQQEILDAANLAPEMRESQRGMGQFLLDLTQAFVDWRNGDLNSARVSFLRLSDEAMPRVVNTRAIFALAELLLQAPDDSSWAKLDPKLKELDENRKFWTARRYRLLYGFAQENAPARIAELEKILSQDLSTRERLENQVLLATLLRKAGRLMEARLLTAEIEDDVGNGAISPDLRAAYVRECAAIASEQARNGDTEAAARYQVYLHALGEMYDPH